MDSILPFTLLLLTTTSGFSLAFRILFSKKLPVKDVPEDRHDVDSTIRIAETLFFSTIGNIEADVRISTVCSYTQSSTCPCRLST